MSGRPSRDELLQYHLSGKEPHEKPAIAAQHGFSLWDCRHGCGYEQKGYVVEDAPRLTAGYTQLDNAKTDIGHTRCPRCGIKAPWDVTPHVPPPPPVKKVEVVEVKGTKK